MFWFTLAVIMILFQVWPAAIVFAVLGVVSIHE